VARLGERRAARREAGPCGPETARRRESPACAGEQLARRPARRGKGVAGHQRAVVAMPAIRARRAPRRQPGQERDGADIPTADLAGGGQADHGKTCQDTQRSIDADATDESFLCWKTASPQGERGSITLILRKANRSRRLAGQARARTVRQLPGVGAPNRERARVRVPDPTLTCRAAQPRRALDRRRFAGRRLLARPSQARFAAGASEVPQGGQVRHHAGRIPRDERGSSAAGEPARGVSPGSARPIATVGVR
jgi:hypothetical protein